MWPLEALSDQLSQLADMILDATLRHAWQDVAKRHADTPRLPSLAMASWAAKSWAMCLIWT